MFHPTSQAGCRQPTWHSNSLSPAAVLIAVVALAASIGCHREPHPVVDEISAPVGESSAPQAEAPLTTVSPQDWAMWRGPLGNGTRPDMTVPTEFGPAQNVVWKTSIPGRGHADPTVVGDRVLLATAEDASETQSVVCLSRADGHQLWQTVCHTGGFEREVHNKATQASGTVATDGTLAFVSFLNARSIHVTAISLQTAEIVWQQNVGGFSSKFGYSASPTIYQEFVVIAADHQDGGFIAALRRSDGTIVWRKKRPAESTYASPVVAHVANRDQLLLCGAGLVCSFDPRTGESLWQCNGTTTACVGTMVWNDNHVFASGGYPGSETLCVAADGSSRVVWKNGDKSYVPSILYHQNHIYSVNDKGIAHCWDAESGQERWKSRLGGNFSASASLFGQHIYAASEEGVVTVFRASADGFEKVAENKMGDEIFATPVAAYGQLFLRVADRTGSRVETVYCIASSSSHSEQ